MINSATAELTQLNPCLFLLFISFLINKELPCLQELIRLFLIEEGKSARAERRDPCPYTVENFCCWAAEHLQSPRAVWLFSMGFSVGTIIVVLRAAIRYHNKNILQ